jgi:methionyl-tRNA formyltransferase
LRVWQAEAVEADLYPGQVVSDPHVLMVGCSSGALKLLEIQKAGGQRMAVEQFLNAHRLIGG